MNTTNTVTAQQSHVKRMMTEVQNSMLCLHYAIPPPHLYKTASDLSDLNLDKKKV
jgi:hypothetical protein